MRLSELLENSVSRVAHTMTATSANGTDLSVPLSKSVM
jgi:hypothetical protein